MVREAEATLRVQIGTSVYKMQRGREAVRVRGMSLISLVLI